MPLCGIFIVFIGILIIILKNSATHFTWSNPMRLPILTQKDINKDIWFMAIYTFLEYWCSIYSIMRSIYIIYHYSSHSTWSKLMKIPMHIEFAWLMGKYHEKFSFWQYMQFWSIWAVFHSIVKSYWKENMVCFNYLHASSFGGKRLIHSELGRFLGGSMHPE